MALSQEQKQDIFNKAYLGLASQGFRRSMKVLELEKGENHLCAYRGDDGLKCAIGHCIDDKNYKPSLETRGAQELEVRQAMGLKGRLNSDDRCFLGGLQGCHDYTSHADLMQDRLREFAAEYSLTVPDLPNS